MPSTCLRRDTRRGSMLIEGAISESWSIKESPFPCAIGVTREPRRRAVSILATLFALAGAIGCQSRGLEPATPHAVGLNGQWNISVKNKYGHSPLWMKVEGVGGSALGGRFIGATGGRASSFINPEVRDGELRFSVLREYEDGSVVRADTAARLVGDRLAGTTWKGDETLEWEGRRPPLISDQDDGGWCDGSPEILFDGSDLSKWHVRDGDLETAWTIDRGILMNLRQGRGPLLVSYGQFWNFRLQIVFRVLPGSNSGIGLRGRYELQILDDHGRPPDVHGNGAIYSLFKPTINASKPAGEWQEFDVKMIGRYLTVNLNGKVILDKIYVEGLSTIGPDSHEAEPGPILIQGDHGPVDFQKIVVTPLHRCE